MLKKRSKSDVVEEKRIVTGLIVSTKFFEKIQSILKLDHFTNSYLQTVASWCQVFYDQYQKSPFLHIKDIFESERSSLKETDAELIEKLLTSLSEQYTEENINVNYLLELAKDYVRKRELEITVNNISVLNEQGKIDEAEEQIEEFKRVRGEIASSYIINPGDLEQQEEIYRQLEEEDRNFYRLPGDLGLYLGCHKRGDLVSYFGPAKKGKSFTLVNNFKHAVLQKRKTLFWSVEMTKPEILPIVNKSFFPMIDGMEGGFYSFPEFDCMKNQTGDCKKRKSKVIVRDGEDFYDDPKHKICTKCMRSKKQHIREMYEMVVYKSSIYRPANDVFTMRENFEINKSLWSKYGRISAHPKYTLTYDKMMMDMDTLFMEQNFIPDILIIDYADILGINSKYDDFKAEDERWKMLARLAGETNTLVITATQANKAGHTTDQLDSTHQGGFYGKNRHVNLMVGLNQSPEEKADGIMKFGITEARGMPYIPGQHCMVLQDFATGQAYLDGYYKFARR